MSDLPDSWIESPISAVAEVNPRKNVDLSISDLVSFVPMAAVDEVSGTILSPVDRPYGEVSKGFTHFRDGDVIFAKITPSMENGKSAVARGLTNGTGMGSTEFHVFRSNGVIEPEYLWRFVRQKSFRESAQAVMSGAAGQQRVPADYLKNHMIPLPPLPEQRRIVSTVDGLTARTARARKDLDRIPTLITRYKQRLLALAFAGELFSDLNNSDAFKPRALEEAILSTFYGPRFGKDAYVTDGVPTLRTTDFDSAGNIALKDPPKVAVGEEEYAKWGLLGGDLLVTRTGSIGKCALYSEAIGPALPSAYLIRVRLDQAKILPRYALLFLLSGEGQRQLGAGITAVAQPNINAKVIAELQLAIPSLEVQGEIVRRIETAFGWLDRVAADHAAAARLLPKLDAAILVRAFRGELAPQDPSDEPASALLERITAEGEAASAKPKRGHGRAPVHNFRSDSIAKGPLVPDQITPVTSRRPSMQKSRRDDDVWQLPYLAGKLKELRSTDVQSLFRAADLPVADFYKQLAWEIDNKHILDGVTELKAA